ncbi:hypothetical protein Tco_1218118 [Tanacetum coccineum]
MAALKFASSHNMVAFLDKPTESDGFEQIATAKVQTVNEEVQIQALVDKKKVIITKTSIRRDFQLVDENGTECLPNATIFAELERMGAKTTAWNEFSSTTASAVILFLAKQVEGMSKHKEIYVTPSHTKKVFANIKRQGKDFSGRDTPLFPTMIVQAQEQVEPVTDATDNVASVPTHSNDPLLSDKGLGDQEDASKQRRKIVDINADADVTLVDETQGMNDEEMFDTGILDGEEVFVEQDVVEKEVITTKVATDNTTATTVDELTLAQTLIEIKAAKPKAVTRPKVRGVVVQEPSEFTTTTSPSQPSQLSRVKDKGKAKMVEPEKPLKKKDQIMYDQEVALNLQAQLDAELEEEEKLAKQREEDANITEWDNVQAMIDVDYELAARLQTEEQGEFTIKEKAEEQRRKPPNKAQKRNTMSTYLKNMAGYKHNKLKTKSFEDIQMLFDKEMKRVNTFVDMDTELVKGRETRTEGSSKRAGEELESENLKKQKLDENVEAKVDDEAEMKKHMEIVPDDEVAIDAIPLATKPPIIVDWKIIKEGKMGYFQIIRADTSSKRYSSMIRMLQSIDKEDLETLWKLVKAKHGLTRPEEAHERVLRGDLKVMFEPDVESKVWRNLQRHKVTVWKLFSSSGVHFVRF